MPPEGGPLSGTREIWDRRPGPRRERARRDLLVCAYAYPPSGGPTERRWAEFVRHLAGRGWTIDVLTIAPSRRHPRYDPGSLALIPENVRVFRTPPSLAHRWQALKGGRAGAPTAGGNGRPPRLRLPDRLYRSLVCPWLLPDRWVDWVPVALAWGRRLLRDNDYRLIVSSSSPQSVHLAGYFLHRWSGRPWCGDWSDPLGFNPNLPFRPLQLRAARWLENRLVSAMDRVIVSTEATRQAYLRHYGERLAEKVRVVHYAYSDEIAGIPAQAAPRFRLAYTGIFLKTIRPPYVLFDGLRRLRGLPLEVAIAGLMEAEFIDYAGRCQLDGLVRFLGHVPHHDAIALLKGSAALLLFGNQGGLQLPGKLFDYIAVRRPILSVKFEEPDLAADLVERHRRGLVVPAEAGAIARSIEQLYAWYQAGVLETQFDLEPLDQYCWAGSARRLESVLCELLS